MLAKVYGMYVDSLQLIITERVKFSMSFAYSAGGRGGGGISELLVTIIFS